VDAELWFEDCEREGSLYEDNIDRWAAGAAPKLASDGLHQVRNQPWMAI
jgi:hypothetical protein